MKENIIEYFINLDERGEFNADVRRNNETIFEINGFDIFEDGFMKNKNDLAGLTEYLNGLGIIRANDSAIKFGN